MGRAVVPLVGPWKFHTGDDPRWARSDYNDSAWQNVDLTVYGAKDYFVGLSEFVPGWTTMGHPGYSGYSGFAWYRLKLRMEHPPDSLAILMPTAVDDAYQIFANGKEIGQFGDFTHPTPVINLSTAEWFPLPVDAVAKTTEIAVRFYMDPSTPLRQPDAGGMHGAPRLGDATVIAALGNLFRHQLFLAYASWLFELPIALGFCFALVALFWLDRSEWVYLWFSLAYGTLALLGVMELCNGALPGVPVGMAALQYLASGCWSLFLTTAWWFWFEQTDKRWLLRLIWVVGLAWCAAIVCSVPPLLGSLVPLNWALVLHAASSVCQLGVGFLFAAIVVLGIRRQGREAWLMVPAALLFAISLFNSDLTLLHVPATWLVFGVRITIMQVAQIFLSAVLGVLILRRFHRSQRRQQQLEADLRQAQQVQQVLLPQAIPEMPGFRIQCEYRPAQEVGGDFFQILETRHNGALVVIGDVSGKGVRAAMLVALIVGTLRTAAEETEEPQAILQRINRRLVGRMDGGFATCLCARIGADGSLTVANAGHLAPWLDGQEMEVPYDLPLGITDDVDFTTAHLRVPENGTLTLLSDGVVEARNAAKELFGFDRVRVLSTESATRIADAAKHFGQEDDITVVTIQWAPVPAYA